MPPSDWNKAKAAEKAMGCAWRSIEEARMAAVDQHGPLQGGMKRWMHHIKEEVEEVVDEMMALDHFHDQDVYSRHKLNLMVELAQLAQLAQSMLALLYQGREQEGKDTWQTPQAIQQPTGPEPSQS